jgi:uncharacterized protein HemX
MIKINLLAERKPTKTKAATSLRTESLGTGANLLLVGIFALGLAVAGAWWWSLDKELGAKQAELEKTKQELKRLEEAIKKSEEYELRKALLARKIELITDLRSTSWTRSRATCRSSSGSIRCRPSRTTSRSAARPRPTPLSRTSTAI